MKKFLLLSVFVSVLFSSVQSQDRLWRVNNNPGITADFTTFNGAVTSASVQAGDTIYLEPSTTGYTTGSFTMSKRVVVIGPGYFLDPASVSTPANPGLQVATANAELPFMRMGAGATGTKFLGIT